MTRGILLAVLVLYPFAGGLIVYAAGLRDERLRDYLADGIAVSEFLLMAALAVSVLSGGGPQPYGSIHLPEICGFGLTFTLDGFRVVYGSVAALMWMMTTILSREYFAHHGNRNRFYFFLLWTLGATMGVFLSADLYTTFVFFEIMSFTSYVWVAQEETAPALRAAETYLAVAVIGGLVMLMGVFLLYHTLGTLTIAELLPAARACRQKGVLYAAGCCMLVGFGAKAGAFPLHIWLPKAHPVAPAPASALLSGILTKTGIYGVLVLTGSVFLHDAKWGSLLLAVGVPTMFGGALLAVFSVDLKRTLACSSMSQIGFILVGAGMQGLLAEENALAVHGTVLHMVNHSLIKLVLFMAAGVIYMNTHSLDLNEIRGFGRKKPLLAGIFAVGALAIGGIPLFSGYISKTLLHESIVEFHGGLPIRAVEWIFLFSGGLTVAYMTKLFVSIFVEKNVDAALQERYDGMTTFMNRESAFALAGSAGILLVWGLFPHAVMDRTAALAQSFLHLEEAGHRVHYFSLTNLSGALISIGIGAAVYYFFIRRVLMCADESGRQVYADRWPAWLDVENLIYRPILLRFLPFVLGTASRILDLVIERQYLVTAFLAAGGVLCRMMDRAVDCLVVILRKTIYRDSPLPRERVAGNALTEKLGQGMNALQWLRNRTWGRRNPTEHDYVRIAALDNEVLKETNTVIRRSLSFGLMLFCIGLCLTLVYLII